MNLTTHASELIINDAVTSLDDYLTIRDALLALVAGGNRQITLRFNDSFSVPSAVIGLLMKLIHQDHVALTVLTGDKRLFELFEELQLTSLFNVRML